MVEPMRIGSSPQCGGYEEKEASPELVLPSTINWGLRAILKYLFLVPFSPIFLGDFLVSWASTFTHLENRFLKKSSFPFASIFFNKKEWNVYRVALRSSCSSMDPGHYVLMITLLWLHHGTLITAAKPAIQINELIQLILLMLNTRIWW